MSDAIFIVTALLPEFAGPVLPAGLLIWGIRKFMRIRRLRRSLRATKGDAAARQMEYDRIGAGVISFLGWAGLPVVLAAALSLGMEWGKALTCAALCGGVILYGSQRLKSRHSRDFKEKVVRAGLEKIFENLSFQPDGGPGEDVLRSSELLPSGRTDCHDLITARYRGLDFSQCDIRIQDGSGGVSTTEDSREGAVQSRQTCFRTESCALPPTRLSAVLCWWCGAISARPACSQIRGPGSRWKRNLRPLRSAS